MLKNATRQQILNVQQPRKKQSYLTKSTSISSILQGGQSTNQEPNSHFIDSLQRFKKDHAFYDKQQRERQREKKLRILQERKNQQVQRESRMRRNQFQYDQKNTDKVNQSRYLCEIGLKKTGFSNGMPMNPITLQYHQNPFGTQQKYTDQEIKLKGMVRAHYIQNASTCGYNPINGQNLASIKPLIPKNSEGRFQEKLGLFQDSKRLDPNADLHLNPKYLLPKHVGEEQRGNHSPIKGHNWQDDEQNYQSSYSRHFNQKPHEQMYNTRMEQSNLYKQYLPQIGQIAGAYMYMPIENYSQAVDTYARQNNENINPYMQDTAFQSQSHEMRR